MRNLIFARLAKHATIIACFGVLATSLAHGQQVPEQLYAGMKWRMIGPFRAGKVNAVAGVPGNPAVYYFAADGGTVWKPIFDKEPVASIGAMALAPSNPNIIYVGTGVNTIFADSSYGDGVYKSADGGENWQHVGLEDSRHIGRIRGQANAPDNGRAAATAPGSAARHPRALFRPADGARPRVPGLPFDT